ncbi:MAG: alpha-L-fucosidase [Candidatus Sumerlaeota bacterium]|nr:alpha-L-fucosidase [Candidatus Sumerlaeota bacterium]
MPEFPREAIRRFDARQFVDHLEHGKVAMIALFAKCHFGNSFYNTRVGHKHAGLEQDFLMETAAECRRRGIRTLAYYSLCWEKRAWDENPDWRWQDREGKTHGADQPWGWVCMNTPYKDELVMPQLREIAEGYPVDGFWLDIPIPAGGGLGPASLCHCPSCRAKWRTQLGIDLAAGVSPEMAMRLDMMTIEQYLTEIRQMIQETNPELVVALNVVGRATMNRRVKELCEIGTWESQPHGNDYLSHSFAVRTGRNDITDLQTMTVRFYQHWGDLTLKPTPQLITECASIIGNGGVVAVGDQVGVDGTLQPPVYDTLAEAFGFIEEREKLIAEAEPVRHVVVLLPVPDDKLPFVAGLANPRADQVIWRGAHKMLVESHIQVDVAYSALESDLSKCPMIILPEPCAYPKDVIDRLREYVRQGGTLVAVGSSLIKGGAFALEDVFGIRFIEPFSMPRPATPVMHFVPAAAVRGETADIALQLRGQTFKVVLDGAEELAAIHLPQAWFQPPQRAFRSPYSPASRERSPFPFATVHTFGKGKAVYVAASIFETYWRTCHHWLRQFMDALLRHVDPTIPYRVEAATNIEANLMSLGSDLLLNLIHYQIAHQGGREAISAIERVHPVHDIACEVRCNKVDAVVLEPEGRSIPYTFDNGICRFVVPEIQYMAMVRLKRS